MEKIVVVVVEVFWVATYRVGDWIVDEMPLGKLIRVLFLFFCGCCFVVVFGRC